MAYQTIKSYTATATIAPKSIFATSSGTVGVVDDTDTVASYVAGDEVPVIVEGLAKLSATTQAYDAANLIWVDTPAVVGDVLFYDGAVKIDDGTGKSYQIVGKVVRVINTNLYELRV